jgi:predicted anti-sigma-YlaC factor YlaD
METLDLHLSEDQLEAYALHRADEYTAAAIEDHLLLCPFCRMALDRLEEEIEMMRLALN